MKNILAVVLIVFAGWASAQSYPEPSDLSVNDFAGILSDDAEARLSEKLDRLRDETDVELVVLTLSRQDMFAPDIPLKKFARGIFDEWGVGDKKRDDGVLVLVLRGDQAIRITLGKAYGNKADKASDKAVERSFLPEFREARYESGIETGVDDLISNLVMPYVEKRGPVEDATPAAAESSDTNETEAADSDTTEPSAATSDTTAASASSDSADTAKDEKKGGGLSWLLYVVGGIGAIIAFFKFKSANRKCPKCGTKGYKVTSNTIVAATEENAGRGERISTCDACGHRDVEPYEIAKRPKSEEPEPAKAPKEEAKDFSGGEAGKKGTTGKW